MSLYVTLPALTPHKANDRAVLANSTSEFPRRAGIAMMRLLRTHSIASPA